MSTLSYLPSEVITRLLSFLSPKELAPCARLSKQFLSIIETSSILTYALELGKAGLEDTYFLNFDRLGNSECNPSELLAELRKRECGWSSFTWRKHLEIPVEKKYTNVEVCGSVFAGGYARFTEEGGVNTIDVFDSNVASNEPVTTLSLGALYSGYATDAGQDLLVLIGKCARTDSFCKLHLRTLSSGLEYEHTEINQSTLSLQLLDTKGYWMFYRSTVQIVGDYLLFAQHACTSSDVKLVNWKTGQFLTIYSGTRTFLCTMISDTEVLLVGCGEENVPSLKYYTIDGFHAISSKIEGNETLYESDHTSSNCLSRVTFNLPFRNRPGSNIPKTWEAELILSETSYTPKPFSPFLKTSTFVYPPNPRIIGVRFHNNDATSFMDDTDHDTQLSYMFDIFIHLESLRKLKTNLSSTISLSDQRHPIVPVPWQEWGPEITRVLECDYNAERNRRCLRGYRVLTPNAHDSRMPGSMILDFNENAWHSSMDGIIRDQSELLTCDGIRIKSSLPYREIHLLSSQGVSNEFGIHSAGPYTCLMGDDIICIDEELPNTRLHVFQF